MKKDAIQYPKTGKQAREEAKRQGPDAHPGKAGRVAGKGKAPTSNKAFGGKMAR